MTIISVTRFSGIYEEKVIVLANEKFSKLGLVKFVFLILYFAILTTERIISLFVCLTGDFSSYDALDYYMITLTAASIICALAFAAVQCVKYRGDKRLFGRLAAAAGILLLGGMVHTEGTVPGIQFASYGMILVSMAAHTVQGVKEHGGAGAKWLMFAYTVAYSMSIPVVYHTGISLKYLFIPIEIIVSAGMVVLFTIMLKRFYDKDGENEFALFPFFAALVGDVLVLALRWREEINMFVLIFICVTAVFWITGKIVCSQKNKRL